MNKLREWFRRMAGGEVRRMGFGSAAPKPKPPTVGLLAVLPSLSEDVASEALKAGADGLVVPAGLAADAERLRAVMQSTANCLWGLQLGEGKATESTDGFDFLLLSASSYLSTLDTEDMGRLIAVDPSWDDMQLRAVDQIPVEGVVFSLLPTGEDRPRLEHLLALRRISMLMRKALIVELRRSLPSKELAALRDGGLSAILVPGDTQKWVEIVKEFRKTIDTLPIKAKAPREREVDVVLPTTPHGKPSETEQEEEEEP